ncbi:hypothetical protein C8R44DRAFT_879861 [Mycena epipterygia]|nr:hypothetical protein C8R44DRAFT_879861 [Mycena epipterygia]
MPLKPALFRESRSQNQGHLLCFPRPGADLQLAGFAGALDHAKSVPDRNLTRRGLRNPLNTVTSVRELICAVRDIISDALLVKVIFRGHISFNDLLSLSNTAGRNGFCSASTWPKGFGDIVFPPLGDAVLPVDPVALGAAEQPASDGLEPGFPSPSPPSSPDVLLPLEVVLSALGVPVEMGPVEESVNDGITLPVLLSPLFPPSGIPVDIDPGAVDVIELGPVSVPEGEDEFPELPPP